MNRGIVKLPYRDKKVTKDELLADDEDDAAE